MPQKQPKQSRLWLTAGSCRWLHPHRKNHVWADDLVTARAHKGKLVWLLTVVDEYTREWLAIVVARHVRAEDVLHQLTELFVRRGMPEHLRSDNGTECTARAVRAG